MDRPTKHRIQVAMCLVPCYLLPCQSLRTCNHSKHRGVKSRREKGRRRGPQAATDGNSGSPGGSSDSQGKESPPASAFPFPSLLFTILLVYSLIQTYCSTRRTHLPAPLFSCSLSHPRFNNGRHRLSWHLSWTMQAHRQHSPLCLLVVVLTLVACALHKPAGKPPSDGWLKLDELAEPSIISRKPVMPQTYYAQN